MKSAARASAGRRPAADREWLHAAGTSPAAIRRHYDVSDEFFRVWLGPDMVYSCALWDPPGDPTAEPDTLAAAQARKIDWFAAQLGVGGGRVLDVGCGWGALLDRLVHAHGAVGGVGLTLSPRQVEFARDRSVPGVDYRLQHWADHDPDAPYDAITCIEATEHLASDDLDQDEKVAVYRAFFERCATWLRPDGRLGLQLICLDNVSHRESRPGRGPLSELIRTVIFPESMPASLSELVLGWETHFRLERFLDHSDQYHRTFRAWRLAAREHRALVRDLVGTETATAFEGYFATGATLFRRRDQALYRVVLSRRPQPKVWTRQPWPNDLPVPGHPTAAVSTGPVTPPAANGSAGTEGQVERVSQPSARPGGASAQAVQSHYDISDRFFATWLDPTLMYTSGWWTGSEDGSDLLTATRRKIDTFADLVLPPGGGRVLDVGCGWGGALRRLVDHHGVTDGVGLTLSAAQYAHATRHPVEGVEVRLDGWEDHHPDRPYDAVVSFGAFEHFARDGTDTSERISRYREFFGRCFDWLRPDSRLGLETIAHDDAPDTNAPLGRGPLGDSVLDIFPESICPHLSELVLGFEPWFEVRMLRSDAGDFARTCRAWGRALRAHEREAVAAADATTVRRFRQYLASSEVQFRLRTITNYRVVLQRRPEARW